MALASLDDVNRILGFTTGSDTTRDAKVRAALAAIESWAEPRLRHVGQEGSFVHSVFDVHEDATLWLPVRDAVVTLVRVYDYPSVTGLNQFVSGIDKGYELTDDGGVILRPLTRVEVFDRAYADRLPKTYARVDVHYQTAGQVPRAVTEGVAILAAGHYKDPGVLGSLKSERIGDYSYTNAEDSETDEPSFVKRGMWWLTPYLRKKRVAVM